MSIILAILLFKSDIFYNVITFLSTYGPLSVFLGGVLFVCTFTVSFGFLILSSLTTEIPLPAIVLSAGIGGVVGDLLIFRFVKNSLTDELSPLYLNISNKVRNFLRKILPHKKQSSLFHIRNLVNSKYFGWTLPVLGALVIASPLPDEIGVSLIGITKMQTYKFILLSFLCNTAGIFFILTVSSAV